MERKESLQSKNCLNDARLIWVDTIHAQLSGGVNLRLVYACAYANSEGSGVTETLYVPVNTFTLMSGRLPSALIWKQTICKGRMY